MQGAGQWRFQIQQKAGKFPVFCCGINRIYSGWLKDNEVLGEPFLNNLNIYIRQVRDIIVGKTAGF